MNADEIEAEAMKLPEDERVRLAELILASLSRNPAPPGDDPIFGIGRSPIEDDDLSDGSVEHDRHIY